MAKGYKKSSIKIPIRDEKYLRRFPIVIEGQAVVPWDMVVPGIYPDEEIIELDSGELLAVSVEAEWKENNTGVAIHGFARWINDDGSTILSSQNKPVETSYAASFRNIDVDEHGVDVLAAEVMKLVLGSGEPKMLSVEINPDIELSPGEGLVDAARTERPLLDIPPDHAESANIKLAINNVKKIKDLRVKV